MNKLIYQLILLLLIPSLFSCNDDDTSSYADLVSREESHIDYFIDKENLNIKNIDEEKVNDWTKKVLRDSIDPASLIELGQWYNITEGNFKRLCFRVNKWGENHDRWLSWKAYQDSIAKGQLPKVRPDSVSFYDQKMQSGSYVLIRYDSLFNMTDTLDIHKEMPATNLDPYSYQIIYGWSEYYYATSYYQYQYGSTSTYSCTSGGLAFAPRFLWYGAEVSLIVPFSLVSSDLSSYYYTLYYGKVKYSKPNYLPE